MLVKGKKWVRTLVEAHRFIRSEKFFAPLPLLGSLILVWGGHYWELFFKVKIFRTKKF